MGRRYRGRKAKNKKGEKPRMTVMAQIVDNVVNQNFVQENNVTTKHSSAGYDPKTATKPNSKPDKSIARNTGPTNASKRKETHIIVTSNTSKGEKADAKPVSMLYDILSMRRPAWSQTEEVMIKKFIDPVLLTNCQQSWQDTFGNRVGMVPNKDGSRSHTLFSCHTDTVHRIEGYQKIYLDTTLNEVFVEGSETNCLGADDGTGIYIMLMMIKNKVPGTYIFHRAEEIGGQGSRWIRENRASWLRWYDRAIAFDRKGKEDVIIAQSIGLISSEKFGEALAEKLNKNCAMTFKNCKGGTFTDTANYYEFIGECINLSVGYERQHTSSETQSISFLQQLLPKLINLNWEELPTERKPGPAAPKYPQQNWGSSRGFQNTGNVNNRTGGGTSRARNTASSLREKLPQKKLATLVIQNPRVVYELLIALEPTLDDLWDAEWEVDQMDAVDLVTRFNDTYGVGC